MIHRSLGSTGEKVSAIGIGGWHIGMNPVRIDKCYSRPDDEERPVPSFINSGSCGVERWGSRGRLGGRRPSPLRVAFGSRRRWTKEFRRLATNPLDRMKFASIAVAQGSLLIRMDAFCVGSGSGRLLSVPRQMRILKKPNRLG